MAFVGHLGYIIVIFTVQGVSTWVSLNIDSKGFITSIFRHHGIIFMKYRGGHMPRIRLYMAPMKGFTDHLFRGAFADHFGGFDLAVAPFIASKQDHRIKRKYVKTSFRKTIPACRLSLRF